MLNRDVKALIIATVELYSTAPLTQAIIDAGVKKLTEAKLLLNKENRPSIPINEEEIPYIQINYYSPKIEDTEDVIIPFYATDFYQKEYLQDDYSEEFKLRYELDGKVSYKTIKAGDNEVNFGKVGKGIHWYSLQLEDKYGRVSRRIFNEIWVVNKEEYEIKESESHIITDDDLIKYNINKSNSEVVEDMVNTRVGLTNLFNDLQKQGFRKCVLPNGIYRINKGDPVAIPTNFTVDMNGSTFKLHPYNDSEYGNIGQVNNTMIVMNDTFDSHIINGTFEGDYVERKANGWANGYNGEHSGCFMSRGGEYNSLDNITITQVTGYNSSLGLSNSKTPFTKLGAWEDDVIVKNGVDTVKKGYVTSKLSVIEEPLLASHYMVASVWLGYGGLRGERWNIDFHFYDENQNFIETIRTYQFTRCRIPENAKYFRVTFFNNASNMNGLNIHHMKSERNFAFNNCHWVDNRTCSNPNQFQHLTYLNCDFTRSGQSITPCEIDLEDGWEQMQDFFLEGCEIKEHVGTACLISCAGINHQVENCKNFNFTARYNIRGITMRNNENCGLNLTVGYKTGNTLRCYNNSMSLFRYGDTGEYFEKEKMKYMIKNNSVTSTVNNEFAPIKNCIVKGVGSLQGQYILDSTIYRQPNNGLDYIIDNIYARNCIYKLYEDDPQTVMKFSFNKYDAKRIYEECIYERDTLFAPHHQFNSGIWNNCVFKGVLTVNPNKERAALCMGAIQFNYCTFEKDLIIDSKISEIQFNGCTFLGNIIYKNNAESLVEFNDEIPIESKYIKIDSHLEYMNINESYKLAATVLPCTAKNLNPIWESLNKSVADIDENGNLIMKKAGICSIKASNYEGTISDISEINFVDVDYKKGCYINNSGNYQNYTYSCVDNRYKEVIGGSLITVTKTPNVRIMFIYVSQYDENKNFIQTTNIYADEIDSGSTTLNKNTKYVLIGFRFKSNTEDKFPELFGTYTIE